jgi:hypothetical protein
MRAQAHLETCADCRAQLSQWEIWKVSLSSATPHLSSLRIHNLANHIVHVMASNSDHDHEEQARPLWPWVLGGALAAVLTLFVLTWLLTPVHTEGVTTAWRSEANPPTLEARVTLSGDGDADWRTSDDGQREIFLARGMLTARVEPLALGERFSLCTASTCVRVIGTEFSVRTADSEPDSIAVYHGVVSVSPSDAPWAELILRAGESLSVPWHSERRQSSTEERRRPDPASALKALGRDTCAASANAIFVDPEGAEHCFLHLGYGRIGAERWASLADAYWKAHKSTAAYAAYQSVYREFPKSPEAESALFFLAEIEEERGNDGAARGRLGEYLRRYPHGDFRSEVAWHEANIAVRSREFARAVEILGRLTDTGAHQSDALFLLAAIHDRELGEPARAIALYRAYVRRSDVDAALRARAKERLRQLGVSED